MASSQWGNEDSRSVDLSGYTRWVCVNYRANARRNSNHLLNTNTTELQYDYIKREIQTSW